MILHAAGAWWIFAIIFAFCLIDGFLPILPSETLIVALAALSVKSGEPNLVLLAVGGAAGAMAGDNIAYRLGRRVGTTRFAWMRRPRAAKAFHWARYELDRRGAMLVFTARYIPVGRTAVNFTAGATGYPLRRFIVLDSAAAVIWAGYAIGIGVVAGRWVHKYPLLGAAVALVLAIVIGFIVDHVMQGIHRWRGARTKRTADVAGSASSPAGIHTETRPPGDD